MSHSLRSLCLLSLAALACAAPARAIVYLDNLGAGIMNSVSVRTPGAFFGLNITTDNSAPSFTLNSITLHMDASLTGNTFAIKLYSNSDSNLPGTLLATSLDHTDPSVEVNYTYTFSAVTLQPLTTYWLAAGFDAPGTGSFRWYSSDSPPSGSWQYSPFYYALTLDGTNWIRSDLNFFQIYAIDATPNPVPEPATCALLCGLPALALAALRRRKT